MQPHDPAQVIRDARCPICRGETSIVVSLSFGTKMGLPERPDVRVCEADGFAFLTDVSQAAYDDYYASVVNDYCRREIPNDENAPVVLQKAILLDALGGFFETPKRVLDYGCGEADLLTILAAAFPESDFVGYDPSPSAAALADALQEMSLDNLMICGESAALREGRYDLIIVSHVLEHIIDFSTLARFNQLLNATGELYVEVPDALHYAENPRRSFLYYFDRVHVNHFSPAALQRLLDQYGFSKLRELSYKFPYTDGGSYPALGMLFKKGDNTSSLADAMTLKQKLELYVMSEHARAKNMAAVINGGDGLLVWGGGDNFSRALTNGGPLSGVANIILLDKNARDITVGGRRFSAIPPAQGIDQYDFPVAVMVSQASGDIVKQITAQDPTRQIFLL